MSSEKVARPKHRTGAAPGVDTGRVGTASMPEDRIRLALVHYPVKGKKGETIASAITNLDLHDIARLAKTYGVQRFYVVTPLKDQKVLAEKIMAHWQTGFGAGYNPDRREALDLVKVVADIDGAVADIESPGGKKAKMVATSAVIHERCIGFGEFREILAAPESEETVYLLVLGTAWGLADAFVERADYILAPVCGKSGYNHLSVRSAAAIMTDRILGSRD